MKNIHWLPGAVGDSDSMIKKCEYLLVSNSFLLTYITHHWKCLWQFNKLNSSVSNELNEALNCSFHSQQKIDKMAMKTTSFQWINFYFITDCEWRCLHEINSPATRIHKQTHTHTMNNYLNFSVRKPCKCIPANRLSVSFDGTPWL